VNETRHLLVFESADCNASATYTMICPSKVSADLTTLDFVVRSAELLNY
jgi:hypothetical protein